MKKPTLQGPLTTIGAVVALVLPFVAAIAAIAVVAVSGQSAGATTLHTATQVKQRPTAPPGATKSPKKKPPPTTPPPTTPPPTTPPPTTPPPDPQTCSAVVFGGESYCPGFIVGVTTGAYGTGARIVLQSVTVFDAVGSHVTIAGGPSCLPDPSGGPVFCGATVPTLEVDLPASTPPPGVGAIIDVYGTTTSAGGLDPAGYVLIGCDPTVGAC